MTADDDEHGAAQAPRPPRPPFPTSSGFALLTTTEVAEVIRRSPASVRTLARNGQLPAHPAFPTKLLFRWVDVARFIRGPNCARRRR